MKLRDGMLLFLLAALWGASFLFVRIAVPVLGPFPLVAARVLLGGTILLVYAVFIHQLPNWRLNWKRYLLIGLFNNVIPFTLIATAQLNLTASFAALLNATTPLFSAVIAALWIKERLTAVKVVGLLLGIVGVAVVVGWQPDTLDTPRLLSIAMMLGATLSYGIASVYGKVAFKETKPIATATGQLISSSALILPIALINPPQHSVEPITVVATLGLALFSTSIAYIIYFHLIKSSGPTIAASVTLLIPFFSSLWGAIFLSEQLYSNEVIGFLIILIGLCLVTGLWRYLFPQRQSSPA